MRIKKKIIIILTVAFLLSGISLGYLIYPTLIGTYEARKDIESDTPRYLIYGELAPFENEAFHMLEEKYGIKAERVAGCIISLRKSQRWDAYNRAINEHLDFQDENYDNLFVFAVNKILDEERQHDKDRANQQMHSIPKAESDR